MKIPENIREFSDLLSELPGIGPRQAIRLAYYITGKGRGYAEMLSNSISAIGKLKVCPQCFHIHNRPTDLCEICSDPERDPRLIAVIEKETDLISIENTEKFSGHYLILGDLKKNGILESFQKLKLTALEKRIEESLGGKVKEIIIALNPTTFGDLNAASVQNELAPFTEKVTRLARGIPTGGEIEFADSETLSEAIKYRK